MTTPPVPADTKGLGHPAIRAEATTLRGHFWTIALRGLGTFRASDASPWNWHTRVADPAHGSVVVTGRLDGADAEHLLIVVHGLGGWARSHYCVRLARTATRHGWACLRLNLRGADRSGEDLYNAALASDLEAVIADPACRRFRSISLVGFSLGGHIVLHYLAGETDERVAAAAVVSPPLDLAPVADHLDSPAFWSVYRKFLLSKCTEQYRQVLDRGRGSASLEALGGIETMRQWDERIVAPRWGYDDAEDYYRRASVAPRLDGIQVPTLAVIARRDPMIPSSTLEPFLLPAPAAIDARWIDRAGHVAFPALDLGLGGPRGLEPQLLRWLDGRR